MRILITAALITEAEKRNSLYGVLLVMTLFTIIFETAMPKTEYCSRITVDQLYRHLDILGWDDNQIWNSLSFNGGWLYAKLFDLQVDSLYRLAYMGE